MVQRAPELRNVELVHMHTDGPATYTLPEYSESFYCNNLFCGGNVRKAVNVCYLIAKESLIGELGRKSWICTCIFERSSFVVSKRNFTNRCCIDARLTT